MMNQEQVIAALKDKLATDARWATRALVRIAKEQTDEELTKEQTRDHNHVGFRPCDAYILTRMADAYKRYRRLTPRQEAFVMKKVPVYARQLIRLTGLEPIRKALQPA